MAKRVEWDVARRWLSVLVGLVSALLLLTNCRVGESGGDVTSSDDLSLAPIVEVADVRDAVEIELEAFRESEDLYAKCLREEGFDYAERVVDVNYPDGIIFPGFEESIRNFGYGIVEGEGNLGLKVEVNGGDVPLSQRPGFESFTSVLNRCSEHDRPLDVDGIVASLTEPRGIDWETLTGEEEYIEAVERWSRCMHGSGYEFRDPFEAFDAIDSEYSNLDPASEDYSDERADLFAYELEVANADMDCYQEHVVEVVERLSK